MKVAPSEIEERKKRIDSKPSVVDETNKRLRVLQAQARVIEVQNGLKDTVCAQIFGENFAKKLFATVSSPIGFLIHVAISLVGLGFVVADFTTEEVPTSVSLACALCLPWGLVVLLLLKKGLLGMLCRFFNSWFLISQAAAMLVCIGYVSERPAVVCFMCPSLIGCILADAFPREARRKVTAFSYFVMITFTIAFDVSLLASLVPVEEPLEFTVGEMSLSGKAAGFGTCIFDFNTTTLYFSFEFHPTTISYHYF